MQLIIQMDEFVSNIRHISILGCILKFVLSIWPYSQQTEALPSSHMLRIVCWLLIESQFRTGFRHCYKRWIQRMWQNESWRRSREMNGVSFCRGLSHCLLNWWGKAVQLHIAVELVVICVTFYSGCYPIEVWMHLATLWAPNTHWITTVELRWKTIES